MPLFKRLGHDMISFSGRHFQNEMILQSIRWYLAYSLSYRDIEEIMKERSFDVDHSTIQRWVVHYAPELETAFHQKKKRPGDRWRLDETYIKVKGQMRATRGVRISPAEQFYALAT